MSIHDQLRLLNVYSLFIQEILFVQLDYDYLHSIFRDSVQFLLRFISKFDEQCSPPEIKEKILQLVCHLIDELCSKAFEFDGEVFRHQLIDLIRIFLENQRKFPLELVRSMFRQISTKIRHLNDEKTNFFKFLIENFLDESKRRISTSSFFEFFARRRTTLNDEFVLELFAQHLEFEREKPMEKLDSTLFSIVKEKFRRSIVEKRNSSKIIAKISANFDDEEKQIEENIDSTPMWIFNELLLEYLIDENQHVVELTRSTLKNLFLLPIGEELFRENHRERLIEIYSIPFYNIVDRPLNSTRNSFVESMTTDFGSIDTTKTFEFWFKSTMNYLFRQIEIFYDEKNESGHRFAKVFLQLKVFTDFQLDLMTKLFPHLIYSILLLPQKFDLRRSFSKHFSRLIDELNEKNGEICAPIGQLVFQTINFLRQCQNETPTKRNSTKTSSSFLNFDNAFWLDVDFFQLAKCATKYRCYSSALIFADIWTTKQRFFFSSLFI